jgi:hypothetical protein
MIASISPFQAEILVLGGRMKVCLDLSLHLTGFKSHLILVIDRGCGLGQII